MASEIASAVLKKLRELEQVISRERGVDQEIRRLTTYIECIQPVLHDAERKQTADKPIRSWLKELKNVLYDVEDVVDKCKTATLRSRVRQQYKEYHKVGYVVQFPHFWIRHVAWCHNIVPKIKELNSRLRLISEQQESFDFSMYGRHEERTITTSISDDTYVCGRKQEKLCVKVMLLLDSRSSTQAQEAPSVVSIVGIPGIGKTALAHSVYNDPEISSRFEKRIWIHVSDPFDERRIARYFIETPGGPCPEVGAETGLILQRMFSCVSGKKILVVFDDVETEVVPKIRKLIEVTLKCANPASRILVTTRNKSVARTAGSRKSVVFSLGTLNPTDSWELFTSIAFKGTKREEIGRLELENVGKKILEKCEGLPLSIKLISTQLRFRETVEEWEHTLESVSWETRDGKRAIFGPLLLSYYELPWVSKRCLARCADFPKSYEFNKDELIKFWMEKDLFVDAQGRDMAEECFEDLVMRCFFKDFERDDDGRNYRFKMHGMVHDFATFLNEDEGWNADARTFMEEEPAGRHIQHVSYRAYGFESLPFYGKVDCKKWRSLDASMPGLRLELDWRQFSCLRRLELKGWDFKVLPNEIGKLELLRYLDLSDCKSLKALPESLCDLCNLEILKIRGCFSLRRLPQRIGELIQLSSLQNEYTLSLECLPKGIKRLNNLKEMYEFVVSGKVNDAGIAVLENLSHVKIKKIVIHVSSEIRDASECSKARLEERTELRQLCLKFRKEVAKELTNEKEEQVLEALKPPPCLEWLLVDRYRGLRVPDWIASLDNLTTLKLLHCEELEQLPPLGKLPRLEELELFWLPKVKKVGDEFLGITQTEMQQVVAFPSLTQLKIMCMKMWEEWELGEEEHPMRIIMPHLRRLSICTCPNLKAVPQRLLGKATFESWEIRECPTLQYPVWEQRKLVMSTDWRLGDKLHNVEG